MGAGSVFVCNMVQSGQTETPSQHSYLHCVKGLLVIGCCQHSRCIKSYGTYHGLVNLGFHLDGLSSITEDAGDPAPFHPVAADDRSEILENGCCL